MFPCRHEDLNYVWTTFNETPSMTVQQLSFSINQFKIQDSPESRPSIKTWLRPEKVDQAAYAIGLSPKLIDYFVDLFKMPYPVTKLDQMVLPDIGLHVRVSPSRRVAIFSNVYVLEVSRLRWICVSPGELIFVQ